MVAICVSPIKAEVIRVTRLDVCGVPVTGATSAQVTLDAFTEVKNSPDYEDGQRFLLRKANGQPCVNQKDPGFLNWIEQEITLCTLDPTLLALVSADRLISNSTTGTGVGVGEGLLNGHYSVEVWQPVAGSSACSGVGTTLRYVYWAFPNLLDAQYQDFTFQDDTFTFGFKGRTQAANPLWTLGASWLTGGATFLNDEHFAFNITTVAPPAAACGALLI